ncbi:unnamed protein product [Ixodes persulcatus]
MFSHDHLSFQAVLYSQFLSFCSYRVRIVLGLKHIDYEYKAIDLYNNEHELGWSKPSRKNGSRRNPGRRSDINGDVNVTLNILNFFRAQQATQPTRRKRPTLLDNLERELLQMNAGGIYTLLRSSPSFKKRRDDGWSSRWASVYTMLRSALEAVLAKKAGQYCVGDSLTIADVCLVPMVYQAKRLGVDMAPYPVVEKLNRSLEELPSFRLGHPRCQPDTPANMREEEPSKRC